MITLEKKIRESLKELYQLILYLEAFSIYK